MADAGPVADLVVPELDPPLDPVLFRFDDVLELTGYTLYDSEVGRGESLSLILRWRSMRETEQDYAIFTQVLGENAHKIGQRDSAVACSAGSVTGWDKGDEVVGHYRIPIGADAEAGTYPLYIGLYGRQDHDRLPIFDLNGNLVGDALSLTEITISE